MWYLTTICVFGLFIDIKFAIRDWHFTGRNVALHKTATQMPGTYHDTFHYTPEPDTYLYYSANLAVDGNNNTNFFNKSCTHTSGNNYGPASWTVDLDDTYNVKGIRIYNRHDSNWIRLHSFIVIGADNSRHTTLYNDNDPRHHQHYQDEIIDIPLNGQLAYNSITIQIPARYRGFNGGEGAFLTLCEVQIFGSKRCERIPSLINCHFNKVNGTINVGQRVAARCSAGYFLQGDSHITCIQDGHWSVLPKCIKITCGYPGSIENGFYSYSRVGGSSVNFTTQTTVHLNQTLNVNCNEGYTHSGTVLLRHCTESGSWTGTQPICTRITCQIPSITSNIQFTYDKHRLLNNRIQYSDTIRAVCTRPQYKLSGSQSQSCGENGQFSGTTPLCVATCQRPVTAHGSYQNIKSQFVEGQTITLVCNDGYEALSPNTKRVCQTDHLWSNNHTQCKPIRCNIQTIPNGSYNVTSANIEFPEAVSLKCKKGFKMINGSKTRTCQSNKSLSGINPVCKEVFCSPNNLRPVKNHYEMIKYLTNPNRIRYNEVIQTTCEEGYERVTGSETRTCIDDDKFNEPELLCKASNMSKVTELFTVTESSNEQQTLSIPIIAGLASGCGLLVVIVIILVVVILRRRRPLHKEQVTTEPYTSLDFSRPGTSNTDPYTSLDLSNTNMALHVL